MDTEFDFDEYPDTIADDAKTYAPVAYTIRGEVLRIVFASEDRDFSIIRLRDDKDHEQTLVGNLGNILEGQQIEATGHWEFHKEHGRQFRVEQFKAVLPTTSDGIRKYLASGVLPGIGATYANRIVDHFGAQTLHILDTASERLKEVPGIGKKRIEEIRNAWHSAARERESSIFLQGLGLSATQCKKVIAKYGEGAAPEVVRRNPYRLADDITGIGFLSADNIARSMGIPQDAPLRLCAGVVYVMDELTGMGHICCPRPVLLERAKKLLGAPLEAIEEGLKTAVSENKLMQETVQEGGESIDLFFPRRLRLAEISLAHALHVLLSTPVRPCPVPYDRLGDNYLRLNQQQRQAVDFAFRYGFSIVTGGPGVGKTTVVNQIAAAARLLRLQVKLAAPTGRAAKRLSEATGRDAETIHRLLKWDVQEKAFTFDEKTPLSCDLLVVDEVSMLDTQLADSLFRAVAPGTRVVLVGDKDQLPSVGPGAVLHDLISCGRVPVTQLTEVYRQAGNSRIITNAHAVNRGAMPDLTPLPSNVRGDFYWIEQDDSVRAADIIARMVTDRIPTVYGFNPLTEVQVLSPMRKGECGTIALNNILQKTINPPAPNKATLTFGNRSFREGDKVMQTSNNYDKGVFNGEMGIITTIDDTAGEFYVQFDVGLIKYQFVEADQLVLAYAVTVHKSQGSEYPVVVMPVLSQHFVMLQKNLIYTGMTRAKKLLIMVGSRRALGIAVSNNTPSQRRTMLVQRLLALANPPAL
ncbi:MAG: ATP-dependent RecD-like DNA helicase [Victivallales bacterium]|nr:ATP-dependent RecD-like DNA helicase [Victivallales bacterium]